MLAANESPCKYGHTAGRVKNSNKCRECHRIKVAEWNAKNKAKRAASVGKYYNANKAEVKAKAVKFYEENRDEVKLRVRAHRHANRSKRAAYDQKRRDFGEKFRPDDIRRMMEEQNGICPGCKIDIRGNYHIDHIVPLARGGDNHPSNLQLLCPPCNMHKHTKMPDEWKGRPNVSRR